MSNENKSKLTNKIAKFFVVIMCAYAISFALKILTSVIASIVPTLWYLAWSVFGLLTVFWIFQKYKVDNIKSFGILGNELTAGFLSALLSPVVFSYFIFSKNDPNIATEKSEGESFNSTKFVIGLFVGFCVLVLISSLISKK